MTSQGMTKRQQDALLAERIMRWKPSQSLDVDTDIYEDESGQYHVVNEPAAHNCFMPSDNLQDAWRLIASYNPKEFILVRYCNTKWGCRIDKGEEIIADSPSQAICLALIGSVHKLA